MIYKRLLVLSIFLVLVNFTMAIAKENTDQDSDQQISEFSLAGYGQKGQKTWDIFGKSADIFTDVVKLKDIIGNLYGEKEDIKLTADKGGFNKTNGSVYLEQNVVITTSSGARLLTNSLDWDRKNNLVITDDAVNIQKENMVTTAIGAKGEPNLKKVNLVKDVKVEINPQTVEQKNEPADKTKVVITCDGPLEIDFAKNIAIFRKNVKVDRENSQIYSDIMDVYFNSSENTNEPNSAPTMMGTKIEKIIARGNVKIVRDGNVSYSEEAIYTSSDKKITLLGRPRLVIYSTEDYKNASLGN